MTNIAHNMSDHYINNMTKEMLVDALAHHYTALPLSNWRSKRKSELVPMVCEIRDKKREEHAKEKAEEAAIRKQTIDAQMMDQHRAACLDAAKQGMESVEEDIEKRKTEIKERMERTDDVLEQVLGAASLASECAAMSKFISETHWVTTLLGERRETHTTEEIVASLEEKAEELTRRCLNGTDYRHNCTAEYVSMTNRGEFCGIQQAARVLRDLVENLKHDLENRDADSPMALRGRFISKPHFKI